jgi:uncharacterized caspase-like protein
MVARLLGWLFGAVVIAGLAVAPTLADENRVALVIGNGAYTESKPLANPPNDAVDLAQALESLGFRVETVVDGDYLAMRRAFRRFASLIAEVDVAVFFYAGHGMQVNGRNYLVPVNAELLREEDLRFEALPVDE